jgi:hypothetical protein
MQISVPDGKLVSVFIFVAYLAVDFRWALSISQIESGTVRVNEFETLQRVI